MEILCICNYIRVTTAVYAYHITHLKPVVLVKRSAEVRIPHFRMYLWCWTWWHVKLSRCEQQQPALWAAQGPVNIQCNHGKCTHSDDGGTSKEIWPETMGFAVHVRSAGQKYGPKIRANVPPKGPCWRHRVCHLGAIVVAWAARWRLGVGRI